MPQESPSRPSRRRALRNSKGPPQELPKESAEDECAKMKRVRVAVVGVGEFGRQHARVYREIEGVHLAGVYDKNPERATRVAAEFKTRAFACLEELRGQVDAASVAVPTL